MSLAGSQQRTLLGLIAALRPAWDADRALPGRIQALIGRNRAFGARDRRLYRELIYTVLRYRPWIEPLLEHRPEAATALTAWLATDLPATARFRADMLAGWPACPTDAHTKAVRLNEVASGHPELRRDPAYDVQELLPAWFRDACPEAFEPTQIDALLTRAPLWLRLAGDEHQVLAEFDQRGWRWEKSTVLTGAIRVLAEADVTSVEAYSRGCFEVQDLASQFVLASLDIAPGGRWLDACAGAGGKTLQLAQRLGPSGHVDAHDIRPEALDELKVRAARARLRQVTVVPNGVPETTGYDGVLVDAPCTGAGTWRRAPHLKWITTAEDVAGAASRQGALLDTFSRHVRPGGRLIYATCSLCRQENAEVIAAFLTAHPDFSIAPPARSFGGLVSPHGLTFLPALHDHDGFFVAALRRAG